MEHCDLLNNHKYFLHDLFKLNNAEDIIFYLLLSKK